MKFTFLFMLIILSACNSKGTISSKPVNEAYTPEDTIEFSHSIHMQIDSLNCQKCHSKQQKSGLSIESNICSECHAIN